MIRMEAEKLRQLMETLLLAAGVPGEDSQLAADNLLQADLRGVNTHGALRLPVYLRRLSAGTVTARPKMKVTMERSGTDFRV